MVAPAPTATTTDRFTRVSSPVGDLILTGDGAALTGCFFTGPDHVTDPSAGLARDDDAFADAAAQLGEYFAGGRTAFDLPLDPSGTAFQLRVWQQLRTIPYGATCSYAEVARGIGSTTGFRAVGLANGRNPISIIVPCHRVIGANGSLTGYGGGLERKRFLLDLEAGSLPFG
ncbi:methylated-DNA--[protein]-cysteine S-methyltransferase [Aquihabitans daechungensis]|uniref:methylated-DNA--[protein]-cysteine S-methyltransferase n=1 Tax=Aquihabitans daechungensis TaxID=1052257 RepID=UPI003BA212BE